MFGHSQLILADRLEVDPCLSALFRQPLKAETPPYFICPHTHSGIWKAFGNAAILPLVPLTKSLLPLLLAAQTAGAAFSLKDDGKVFTIDCESKPAVFMATWAATCPHPGEMRFIARLDSKALNKGNIERPGDDTSDKAIESKDIFIQPDGRTTSKYYSGVKFIDDKIRGSRGTNIGAYFAIGSHESCSGGPFFRDINSQTTGDTEELYFYMFSGHAQTEPFRENQLHGPYALCFTDGPPPEMPAMGWIGTLDLKGWVAQRGRVSGTASGLMPGVPYTIYLENDAFKPGVNTLTIDNLSGSGAKGFISNAFVFDYIGLRK